MNCPRCAEEALFDEATQRCWCPACGWGSTAPDAAAMRQVAEVLALGKEANLGQLVGALLISGGIVALAAYVVFGIVGVWPSALNVGLFVCATALWAVVGWCIARVPETEPPTYFGRMFMLSPVLRLGRYVLIIWLLLWPGRLAGLGAIGVYRFIRARRRLRALIADGRRRPLQHQENVRP